MPLCAGYGTHQTAASSIWPRLRRSTARQVTSRGNPPAFASARIQSFVREVAHSSMPPIRLNRERKRLRDIEWMRQMLQNEMNEGPLHRELGDIPDLAVLLQHLHNGRLRDR